MLRNNDRIKHTLIGAAAFGIIGMAGWTFIEVRDLPAVYPTRIEIKGHINELKHDINERLDRIEKKLDRLVFRGNSRHEGNP